MPNANRENEILFALIELYIASAEPVGSKAIAELLPVSSATVRSCLASLEQQGLLTQPHTSAGRIPTAPGYRMYVNHLLLRQRQSVRESENLALRLSMMADELIAGAKKFEKMLSEATGLPAFSAELPKAKILVERIDFLPVSIYSFVIIMITSTGSVNNKVIEVPEAISESFMKRFRQVVNTAFHGLSAGEITFSKVSSVETATGDIYGLTAVTAEFLIDTLQSLSHREIRFSGFSRLLSQPEFRLAEHAERLLEYLSEKPGGAITAPDGTESVKVTIGEENNAPALQKASLLAAKIELSDENDLLVGVVGPMRMNYASILSVLRHLSQLPKE
ncbi:MAG: heat-inducible transcriptional repressor HrcA [Oscillospiraceae bacterium]|jgi:heat-inducible transcriptional repressor|nr:heat-inducible transcriptional repressor HrcA [Oscillospiraceae bacterium]